MSDYSRTCPTCKTTYWTHNNNKTTKAGSAERWCPICKVVLIPEYEYKYQQAAAELERMTAGIAALKVERDEARAIVIECDALSQTDKQPRSYEEASLAVVYMMSCGMEAMNEQAALQAAEANNGLE